MSKEKTRDEIQADFLEHVWALVDYWEKVPNGEDTRRRLEGLAFSIFSALDGSTIDLPSFIVAPLPHESDKAYAIENEEDYYPFNEEDSVKGDIGGNLHEKFYPYGRANGWLKD